MEYCSQREGAKLKILESFAPARIGSVARDRETLSMFRHRGTEVVPLMGQIENFYHEHKSLPVLVKAALIHVQFETIHPFLDGNGRLGRLLITLMLVADGVLVEPLLYLSLYFKKHRTKYYDLLQKVRFEGNWEEWADVFFYGGPRDRTTGSHDVA